MIDYLAIGVTHLLLVLAMLRLLARADLDRDAPGRADEAPPPGGGRAPINAPAKPAINPTAGRVGVPRLPRLGGRGRA